MINADLKKWHEEEFVPWKKAAEAYNNDKMRTTAKIRQNAAELKYIVSLLLDQRTRDAVRAWNQLDLEPMLRDIRLDLQHGTVEMVTFEDNVTVLNIDEMLRDLKRILSAKA